MHQITLGDLPAHSRLILVEKDGRIGQIQPNPSWGKKIGHFRLEKNDQKPVSGHIKAESSLSSAQGTGFHRKNANPRAFKNRHLRLIRPYDQATALAKLALYAALPRAWLKALITFQIHTRVAIVVKKKGDLTQN